MRASVPIAALALAVAAASCKKPEPPKITPERVRVTSVGTNGLGLDVGLAVQNPNSIDLSARAVSAKATLDGKVEVGPVSVPKPFDFPAGKSTKLDVPVLLRWSDMAGIAGLAASNRDIPYVVDGTVELGGDMIHVEIPFRVGGTVTHQQLVDAALGALPKIKIPGLPGL
jgi:late embryogenesis abundant protein